MFDAYKQDRTDKQDTSTNTVVKQIIPNKIVKIVHKVQVVDDDVIKLEVTKEKYDNIPKI